MTRDVVYRRSTKERRLQRLFPTFPAGRPGLGLLLLRVAVGVTSILEGGSRVTSQGEGSLLTWAVAIVALLGGVVLLIGFLTPVTSILVALNLAALALPWGVPLTASVLDARLGPIFATVMAIALVLLGPGAFSVDSHLFGRREIVIPHDPRSPGV